MKSFLQASTIRILVMAIAFSVLVGVFSGCRSRPTDVPPEQQGQMSLELTVDDMHVFCQKVEDSLKGAQFLAAVQQGQAQELFIAEPDNRTVMPVDPTVWGNVLRADLASIPGLMVVDENVRMNKNKCPYIFMSTIELTETITADERNICYHITPRILSRANKFAQVWSMRPVEFRKLQPR